MSSLMDAIKKTESETLYDRLSKQSGGQLYSLMNQQKQSADVPEKKKIPYQVELVRDHDGTYYANVTMANVRIGKLPEYVPYRKLKAALKEYCDIELPNLKDLTFQRNGRKQYAHISGEII